MGVSKYFFTFLGGIFCFNGRAQNCPNIVLFLVDDMGWQDCSVPFWTKTTTLNARYHTPNMELLAKEGMKFTNAYTSPICSPSRISLMTGMNAASHKVTNWTLEKDEEIDGKDSVLTPPLWNINGMSPVPGIDRTTYVTPLPAILKAGGYYTIHCGKAHFGAISTPAEDPINIGFDVNIAGHAAGGPGSYLSEEYYGNYKDKLKEPWGVPGLQAYYGTHTFLTEALTREALKAIDKPVSRNEPFFLYMAHYAIHVPYAPDKRFMQKYLDAGLSTNEAEYAALVEGMDKSLGDIMKYLKEKGIDKNTIIIFMSDNGGLSLVPPRSGTPYTSKNFPLKAGKGSIYEGGIRVPMIVKWPEVVKENSINNNYLIIEDFFPTILEMAGVKNYKTVQTIDGISFVPLLKNPKFNSSHRPLIWHFPNKWISYDGYGTNFRSAIRLGNWKLIYNWKTGKKELYNLKYDIEEQKNISDKYPDKTKELLLLLTKKLKEYDAQRPINKQTNKALPWPQ
ncbi:sulfatase [Parafilimonas sp.]|uniref:sulfatase n=1 Tax=Parafilimonas sp. TaxID=1969739 RepID=UPI0039E46B16